MRATALGSASPYCNGYGICTCISNVTGIKCAECNSGYYNFPTCLGKLCKLNKSKSWWYWNLINDFFAVWEGSIFTHPCPFHMATKSGLQISTWTT